MRGCADADFVIVDGLLRKPDQVARIISLAQDYGFDRILIIHVDTPAEVCLSRPDRDGRSDEGAILRRIGDFEKETMPAKRKMLAEHPDFVDSITLDGFDMFKDGDRYVEAVCALYASDLALAA